MTESRIRMGAAFLLQDIWKYVILFVFLYTILKTSSYGDNYTDIRRILKQGYAAP